MKKFIQFLSSLAIVLLISSFTTQHFFPISMTDLDENAILTASDGANLDHHGGAVDISGDYAIVGAPDHDVNGNSNQGQVYIYYRNNAVWEEQAVFTVPNNAGVADDQFGHSVRIEHNAFADNSTAVVGANGSAYVYVRDGTNWNLQQELVSCDSEAGDWFGWSVAISGERILVGAPQFDTNGNADEGKAYIFFRNFGTSWNEEAVLEISDSGTAGTAGANFGYAVDINDSNVAISAFNPNGNQGGKVYVYGRCAGDWCYNDATPTAAVADQFGASVAVSFDNIIVGAPGANAGQGKVSIIDRFDASNVLQDLTGSDGATGDAFGTSVALGFQHLVVGAPQHATNGNANRGKAYIFENTDGNGVWMEESRPIATDGVASDELGFSVGISNSDEEVIVGAPNAGQAGKGYVYHLREVLPVNMACDLVQVGVNTPTGTGNNGQIAADAEGNYIIVWNSGGGDNTTKKQIYARRFNKNGEPLGDQFLVNETFEYTYGNADVAMSSDGSFTITWVIYATGVVTDGAYARHYDANGQPLGNDFLVSEQNGFYEYAAVDMNAQGESVICYVAQYDDVFEGKKFNSDGTLQGDFSFAPDNLSSWLDVSMNDAGDFNLIWNSSVYRFNADLSLKDDDLTINDLSTGRQSNISLNNNGSFIVAYMINFNSSKYTVFDSNKSIIGGNSVASRIESYLSANSRGEFAIGFYENNSYTIRILNSDGTTTQTINVPNRGIIAYLDDGLIYINIENNTSHSIRYTCTDENNAIPITCGYEENIPNDHYANTYSDYSTCSEFHPGNERVYTFELTEAQNVDISFIGGTVNLLLLDNPSEDACITSGNPIQVNDLAAGIYYIIVEKDFTYAAGTFSFTCPKTFYVNDDATGSNNGSSWTNAFTNLQDAMNVAQANPSSSIWVAAGTYYPTQNQTGNTTPTDNREKTFYFDFDTQIIGGFTGASGTEGDITARDWRENPSILSGDLAQNDLDRLVGQALREDNSRQDNAYHVVTTAGVSNAFKMEGFQIQKGHASDLANSSNDTHLNNQGGGWLNRSDNTTLTETSNPQIINCHFSENSSFADGGGFYNRAFDEKTARPRIVGCVFENNYADAGAGVYNHGQFGLGIVTIINSVFKRNIASVIGAGVTTNGSYDIDDTSGSRITNCTFTANQAVNDPSTAHGVNTLIYNSIFYANEVTAGIDDSAIFAGSEVNFSLVEGGWSGDGIGNINDYPYFIHTPDLEHAPHESGNLRLQFCSGAVDRGSNTAPDLAGITTDLDGNPRIFDNDNDQIDMGAYESEHERCIPNGEGTCGEAFTNCYRDLDSDGFGNPASSQRSCGFFIGEGDPCPDGFVADDTDCNDNPDNNGANTNTDSPEICGDCIDNNCDGDIDENCPLAEYIMYVDKDATGAVDGTSWNDAFPDLQDAIDAANMLECPVDLKIWVAEGTYYPSDISFSSEPGAFSSRDQTFNINFAVEIYGGFNGTETDVDQRDPQLYLTILDGNIGDPTEDNDNVYHILTSSVVSDPIILDGFIVQNGYAVGDGNQRNGSAWSNAFATNIIVNNCTFKDNFTQEFGAIYVQDGNMKFINCRFEDNLAANGGAVANINGVLTSEVEFTNCLFYRNRAILGDRRGAIIFNGINGQEQAIATFNNCLMVSNITSGFGQIAASEASSAAEAVLNLNNVTIGTYDEQQPSFDTPLFSTEGSAVNITNSIVWQFGDWYDGFTDPSAFNVSYTTSLLEWTGTGTNNNTLDPLFVDPNSNLRLQSCSPAVNSGNNAANATSLDYDGNPRVFENVIDRGAFELQDNKTNGTVICYRDADGDGFGNPSDSEEQCEPCSEGYVTDNTDTDDNNFYTYPGAPEFCYDNADNNGDGQVNEDCFDNQNETYTIYVNDDAQGRDNGSDWENACNDFQTAMDMARSFNQQNGTVFQIFMAEGTYRPTVNSTFTGDETTKSFTGQDNTFYFDFDVQLYGGFAGNESNIEERNCVLNPTIISGDNATPNDDSDNLYTLMHTFGVSNNFVMDGFVFEKGKGAGSSGSATSLNLAGAGWYNQDGSPQVKNCIFRDNEATNGAGFMNYVNSIGGGANPIFTNCEFINNVADFHGGAFYNQADFGTANPIFYNCVFTGNKGSVLANASGGAVFTEKSNNGTAANPTIINCTFNDNSATVGGAIAYDDGTAPIIHNSILWDNSSEIADVSTGGTGNITVEHSIVQGGWVGTGNAAANPVFVNPPADVRLGGVFSAAYNTGNNNAPGLAGLEFDLDCNLRIFNGTVDMGAYEFGSQALAVEWLNFTAKPQTDFILLNWQITADSDETQFTIERSSNGQDWQTIGTTNQLTFNDLSPLTPVNYYRLTATETTGKTKLSPVVQVDWQHSTTADLSVFPNPTQGIIRWQLPSVQTDEPIQVVVFDITGKVVFDQSVIQKQELNITNLPAGVYALQIEQLGQQWNTRFIKE